MASGGGRCAAAAAGRVSGQRSREGYIVTWTQRGAVVGLGI
jgi:hypothetical protein